jgi:Transposase and inactivated derivatives
MRHLFYHVVTTLVPELLGKDALLNETAEIERRALEEAERTSPRYARGKEVRRRGYARYRFLKGFKVSLLGRRVVYGLEWVTVRLPVLYRGGERVRTRVEEELLREEGLVLRSLLLPVLGGKLNAELWTQS